MSTALPTLAQIEFDSQVKAAYQTAGTLRRRCQIRSGVIGGTYTFRKAARGIATRRVPQTNVVPMGQTYTSPVATLTDWNAAEYTDVFDQAKTSAQERGIVAANIAGAIGRREDQLLLDALDAANGSASIVHGGVGLTYAKLLAITQLFDDRAIPTDKRILVIGSKQKTDLLNLSQFTSGDYVTKHSVETGTLPPLLGMQPVIVEARDEGGLPLTSTTRTCYAYDADALGLAIGIDFRTEVAYIHEKTSWLANGLFSAGAVAIDTLGVIEVECTET